MEWKIKKFEDLTVFELYEILKAREEIFIVEQNCIYHDLDSNDQSSTHLFLENEGQVVCYLRILPRGVKYEEASVGRVITNASYRRKGYGEILVQKAIDFVEEVWGEREIRISAQAHLRGFYGGLGFKVVSDVYLEDGIDHYEMLYTGRADAMPFS